MFNSLLLTLKVTNILPLYALRLLIPSAVVLIYSMDVPVSVNDLLFSDTANRQFQNS